MCREYYLEDMSSLYHHNTLFSAVLRQIAFLGVWILP